ncbi:MAG: ComF family protein [Chitinophagaceae bacterium]|nr:ComF family protein [Chitinophagaceae bacterium]
MKKIFTSILHLFFPNNCVACQNELFAGEKFICLTCQVALPETNLHKIKNNLVEQFFMHQKNVQKATAFYFFSKEGKVQHLLHEIKYNDNKELAFFLGEKMAKRLNEHNWLEGVDVVIPVPLHQKKLNKRGYNQSLEIAKGFAEVSKIELNTDALKRIKNTETQTQKSKMERIENIKNAFVFGQDLISTKKHILLIDDVITTASTLNACVEEISKTSEIKISVLCLAAAIN